MLFRSAAGAALAAMGAGAAIDADGGDSGLLATAADSDSGRGGPSFSSLCCPLGPGLGNAGGGGQLEFSRNHLAALAVDGGLVRLGRGVEGEVGAAEERGGGRVVRPAPVRCPPPALVHSRPGPALATPTQ